LSYEVDALRALMLAGGTSSFGLGWDFSVLIIATVIMVLIGARLYPRVVT
jgi:ABC-2 type transport system permease protein